MVEQTILLVEDNPDDVALTLRAFQRNNIANKIVVARDGAEAIDYLFGQGDHDGRDVSDVPQLVLLDLKLPKISGLDVLRRLRANERTKYIPVVILASSSEESDLITSYDLGANSFVKKPVDYDEFVEAARQLGLYWLVINRPASQ